MAKVIIESLRPIPPEVASEIRGLAISKRTHMSGRPIIRGANVLCGSLSWPAVSERLKEAEVPHVVKRGPKSPWDRLSRIIYRYPEEERQLRLAPIDDDQELQLSSSNIIFQRLEESPPERTYSPAELLYNDNLNTLDEKRALPLDFALTEIADVVNFGLEETLQGDEPLCPWHLVEFRPSGSGLLEPYLARLDKISPRLHECTWGLIHAFERDKNIKEAEAAFDDVLVEVLDDSDALRGFQTLALPERTL